MSDPDRRVIALGNLAGELKASLEAAVRGAGLELLLTREPARAFVELERDGALAMLVDMATLGAEQFCKRARGTERLRSVPVIGMSRHPNELGFARVFAWGADDLVPLGATTALERRLIALRDTRPPDATGFGQAVVAEATTQRRALVGRVLAQAGYEVKFAVDRGAVEVYASQAETRLVVISAALGDPRRMIEAAARAGALPTWIVTAEARSVARLASSLSGLDRVAVTSTSGSPEDVLFLANEIVFGKGARRREWRALYATPVAFRPAGSQTDEYGFSYDASPGGLYVRSLLPCETDEVEVELRLPNRDDRVRLLGKVVRRFAFGSGSIASAPPGFSVKLEGPPDELSRWADASLKLFVAASDAFSEPPPAARNEGSTSGPPDAEAALAVPPATLTIESVVAPLPTAMLEEVDKGTDVGELLAATLDEQTLAQVGTKPVTIDADTLDVREERPSEFAMRVPAELLSEAPAAEPPVESLEPPATSARLPLPAPTVASPEPTPPPTQTSDPQLDWESDAKTAVRQSRPDAEELAPPPAEPIRPPEPTPAPVPEPSELKPAPAWQGPDRTQLKSPSGSRAAVPRPGSDANLRAVADPFPPASPPAPAVAPTEPAPPAQPPPPSRPKPDSRPGVDPRPFAATALAFPPPVPDVPPPPAGLGPSLASPTPASPVWSAAAAPTAAPSPPAAAAPSPAAGASAAAAPFAPVTAATLPSATAAATAAIATAAAAPASPAGSVRGSFARSPQPGSASSAALEAELARVVPPPRKHTVLIIAGVIAGILGAGLVVLSRSPAPAPVPQPSAAAIEPTVSAPEATRASDTPPANETAVPTAAPPATATEPAESAAPVASAAADPGPGPTPTPSAAEATPPQPAAEAPPFDTSRLRPDRAALFVRSSATARVFVHGTDYGETNQWLLTTCGIRHVRIGRALGDFLEPGQARVLKCGKQTELSIEPAK